MLFTTSLVAIVGNGEKMNSSQRRLLIANTKVIIAIIGLLQYNIIYIIHNLRFLYNNEI